MGVNNEADVVLTYSRRPVRSWSQKSNTMYTSPEAAPTKTCTSHTMSSRGMRGMETECENKTYAVT